MGILSRASYVIRSKLNALLNRTEDPTESLDYSYEQMRDELQDVKQGIADLTTQKKRLEIQSASSTRTSRSTTDRPARRSSRTATTSRGRPSKKKKSKMTQIEELEGQIAKLNDTQEQLVEKKNKLQNRIEEFRTKKESMKARYQAAEASSRASRRR